MLEMTPSGKLIHDEYFNLNDVNVKLNDLNRNLNDEFTGSDLFRQIE